MGTTFPKYDREKVIKGVANLISYDFEYGQPNAPFFMEFSLSTDAIVYFLEQCSDDFIQSVFKAKMEEHLTKYIEDYKKKKAE